MAKSTKFYGEWAAQDGKKVIVNGKAYRISVHVYTQRYPYAEEVISVMAEPINKSSAYYKAMKARLGDDWSVDVLESEEFQAVAIQQLAWR